MATVYHRDATVLGTSVYQIVDTAQIGYYRPNSLTGAEAIVTWSGVPTFGLTCGTSLEMERLAVTASSSVSDSPMQAPPFPSSPDMQRNSTASMFIEPRWTPSASLTVSGGMRFDHSSYYGDVLTPRAGATWSFGMGGLRLAYGEAFRAPKPWDYSDGLGNSALTPERMSSLEVGARLHTSEVLHVEAVWYRNELRHALVKDVSVDGYRWKNGGSITTTGLEMTLRYSAHPFSGMVNYTRTDSDDEFTSAIAEISRHTANAEARWLVANRIHIGLVAHYIGVRNNPKPIHATGSTDVGPYLIVDGTLTFRHLLGCDVQVSVNNVFNTEYFHTSNREPDRYRQPQRTLLLSVSSVLSF